MVANYKAHYVSICKGVQKVIIHFFTQLCNEYSDQQPQTCVSCVICVAVCGVLSRPRGFPVSGASHYVPRPSIVCRHYSYPGDSCTLALTQTQRGWYLHGYFLFSVMGICHDHILLLVLSFQYHKLCTDSVCVSIQFNACSFAVIDVSGLLLRLEEYKRERSQNIARCVLAKHSSIGKTFQCIWT